MLEGFDIRKIASGRYRRMALEIYYENLYEKNNEDKVLSGFKSMVTGFRMSKSLLDSSARSPEKVLDDLKDIEDPEDQKDELFEIVKNFFKDNLNTDIEKALNKKDYEVSNP